MLELFILCALKKSGELVTAEPPVPEASGENERSLGLTPALIIAAIYKSRYFLGVTRRANTMGTIRIIYA